MKKFFVVIALTSLFVSKPLLAQNVTANTVLKTAISIAETNVLSFGTISHFATQNSTIAVDASNNTTVTGPDTVTGASAGVYTLSGGSGTATVNIGGRAFPKTVTLTGATTRGSLRATLSLVNGSVTIPAGGSATATVTASVPIPAATQSDVYAGTFIINASY